MITRAVSLSSGKNRVFLFSTLLLSFTSTSATAQEATAVNLTNRAQGIAIEDLEE